MNADLEMNDVKANVCHSPPIDRGTNPTNIPSDQRSTDQLHVRLAICTARIRIQVQQSAMTFHALFSSTITFETLDKFSKIRHH